MTPLTLEPGMLPIGEEWSAYRSAGTETASSDAIESLLRSYR